MHPWNSIDVARRNGRAPHIIHYSLLLHTPSLFSLQKKLAMHMMKVNPVKGLDIWEETSGNVCLSALVNMAHKAPRIHAHPPPYSHSFLPSFSHYHTRALNRKKERKRNVGFVQLATLIKIYELWQNGIWLASKSDRTLSPAFAVVWVRWNHRTLSCVGSTPKGEEKLGVGIDFIFEFVPFMCL